MVQGRWRGVDFDGGFQEGVHDGYFRHVLAHVGKGEASRYVARGVYPGAGRSAAVVYLDASRIVRHACGFEVERRHVRLPPGGDEERIALQDKVFFGFVRATCLLDAHFDAAGLCLRRLCLCGLCLYRGYIGVQHVPDAFFLQAGLQHLRQFLVVPKEHAGRPVDHCNLRAEPPEGLRHFRADGSGSKHDEMSGLFGLFEEGFVRKVGRFPKARDGRNEGPRARSDDEPAGGVLLRGSVCVDFYGVGACEAGGSLLHVDSHAFVDFRGVRLFVDVVAQGMYAPDDFGKVCGDGSGSDAEFSGAPGAVGSVGGAQEGFAGNASVPCAVAAEAGLFHHEGAGAQTGSYAGSGQTGGPASKDDEVVVPGHGVRAPWTGPGRMLRRVPV